MRDHGAASVPSWLRSGPRPGQDTGAYDNPHGHPGHIGPQQLLPEPVDGARFYVPDESEPELQRRLEAIRRARGLEPR